ncbi:ComF family protein [Krasilnikovia sp. MM14-A1259]|uniref:ComF family protein n=1 Tax=Krasilnikovia sp. MM14-A1259 TaxID=3373539 RepID=UPI0038050885
MPAPELLGALADLILPTACAGCDAVRVPLRLGACARCVAELEALSPYPAAPVPPPRGLPPCTAVGPYAGALRAMLLAYKEHGRHRLARPLGALLAGAAAAAAVRAGAQPGAALLLVPVPSTAKAARRRQGDHLVRLAGHAARRLRAAGWDAELRRPLQAMPRPDSAGLSAAQRAVAAESSLRIRQTRIGVLQRRPTMRGTLVVVDDIVTTGATLAAVATRLTEANMQVAGAAVLAATQLRRSGPGTGQGLRLPAAARAQSPEALPRTRGDGRASAR